VRDRGERGFEMTDSTQKRRSLGARIAAGLDACPDVLWGTTTGTRGELLYHIEQAGEVYFFTPGRTAEWLGIPLLDEGNGAD
jgi:hypothetical protein